MLPSPPVMGLSVVALTVQPMVSSQSRTPVTAAA
jgi:hypothetical protein